MKIKKVSLLFSLALTFIFFGGVRDVSALECLKAGGSCWTLEKNDTNCEHYTNGAGKALVSVQSGDTACAQFYAQPVRCCKVGGASSSAKTATSQGVDNAASTSSGSTKFVNPLKFATVEDFLGGVMSAVQKIIVTLALVVIIIGSLMYVTSMGNSKQTEKAKEAITAALVGLALGIAAPSMLKEIASILGWGVTDAAVQGALTLSEIALRILNFLLSILGILSLIMMIIGAGLYLTSAGDEDRIKQGKNIFKYAILGVILAMSALVLVRQVAVLFV